MQVTQNLNCEVCVVGAGISGLTTAYYLSKAGHEVVVFDQAEISDGQTSRSTAHLTWVADQRFYKMIRNLGQPIVKAFIQSHKDAIDEIERLIFDEGIQCEFDRVDGFLFSNAIEIKKEFTALQALGLTEVDLMNRIPEISFDSGPALHFPKQAQLNPALFTSALKCLIEKNGGKVFENSKVEKVQDQPAQVHLISKFTISAKKIVVATLSPIHNQLAYHLKQTPYQSYVLVAQIPKKSVPRILLWDTLSPFHYSRVRENSNSMTQDLLVVGGEDHKTAEESDKEIRFEKLKVWALQHFPMIQTFGLQWSGQILQSHDGLAFLGKDKDFKNIYVITGDSGQGITHASIAGFIICDQLAGKQSQYEMIYSPNRSIKSKVRANSTNAELGKSPSHDWPSF